MQLNQQQAIDIVRRGAAALQKGDADAARALLEQVTRPGLANVQTLLLLATACRAAGDAAAEEEALDRLMALDDRIVRAHVMKGDCRARAGDDLVASRYYDTALRLADGNRIPDDLGRELARAQEMLGQIQARQDAVREAGLVAGGHGPGNRSARFQESLDLSAGRKQIFPQQPTSYYFPGLAPIQFFDPADFEWVPAVESAADAIGAELATWLAEGGGGWRPYLHHDSSKPRLLSNALTDSPDWSALFLCENGVRNESVVAHFPATWAVLDRVPMPRLANQPTVMFSLLRAGARIEPHSGMFNTRLICHLPLIVPPGCSFRVGNEVREWEVGKLLIFDDTIEHEAWNGSDHDRVVLIFDVWRPELTERERQEVSALFAGPPA